MFRKGGWVFLAAALSLPCWAAGEERADFEASAYLGLSVDTFTAQQQRNILYGNPQDNGTKRERIIGGFDFAYRLLRRNSGRDLWVYGQTLHGVRSAEVDCTNQANRPPVCDLPENVFNNVQNPTEQLVYLLRNASSLEAQVGLRYEFATLNGSGENPAKLYLNAQAGFLSIAQSGGDVFDDHRIGIGARSVAGSFKDSHLEVGYGRNDVFLLNRRRRAVIDGYLEFGKSAMRNRGFAPFVQMLVNSDGGPGADSVQSFIGINFDLGKIFGD